MTKISVSKVVVGSSLYACRHQVQATIQLALSLNHRSTFKSLSMIIQLAGKHKMSLYVVLLVNVSHTCTLLELFYYDARG